MDIGAALLKQRFVLRRYAISLLGKADGADDLVQETFVRAIAGYHTFRPGSNFPAWTKTILLNIFRSMKRREKLERRYMKGFGDKVPDVEVDAREQFANLEFKEAMAYLAQIPADQREALQLVGINGMSYETSAKVCAVPVGTIKSRVNRAREKMRDHRPEYTQ